MFRAIFECPGEHFGGHCGAILNILAVRPPSGPKVGHHYHICFLYVCVCYGPTGTLLAEALLRHVQKQGATTAFFVCLCCSIVLGYQYSACGIIALEL